MFTDDFNRVFSSYGTVDSIRADLLRIIVPILTTASLPTMTAKSTIGAMSSAKATTMLPTTAVRTTIRASTAAMTIEEETSMLPATAATEGNL